MKIVALAIAAALLLAGPATARELLNLHLAFGSRTPLYGSLSTRLVAEVAERSGGELRLRPH